MRALGQLPSADLRVIALPAQGLGDADAWVRYYACQSLGRLGVERGRGAIAALLDDRRRPGARRRGRGALAPAQATPALAALRARRRRRRRATCGAPR